MAKEESEKLAVQMDLQESMNRSYKVMQETMNEFLSAASVDAVYSEPIEDGENLIIPAAEVLSVAGFGIGSGFGTGETTESETPGTGEGGGGGGGGGGRVLSRPAAIIVSSPEGVYVEPVIDKTKIGLAAITAAGFVLGMMFRMSRKP
jgi:uncharacterized spore protein YtfJ